MCTYNKSGAKWENYSQRNRKATGGIKIHQENQLFTRIDRARTKLDHARTETFITETS